MKNAVIILSILVVVLGGALFLRSKSAKQELADVQKVVVTLTNQVADLQSNLTARVVADLGLIESVSNRIAELSGLSNRLSRTAASLEKSQGALAVVQQEAQQLQERIRSFEAQQAALVRGNADLTTSLTSAQVELGSARAEARAASQQRDALQEELNLVRTEKISLARQFNDRVVLQAQLAKLKEEQSARKPSVQGGLPPHDAKAKGVKLELQPDGSVKLVRGSSREPTTR